MNYGRFTFEVFEKIRFEFFQNDLCKLEGVNFCVKSSVSFLTSVAMLNVVFEEILFDTKGSLSFFSFNKPILTLNIQKLLLVFSNRLQTHLHYQS